MHGPSARLAVVTTATPPSGQSVWTQRTLAAHLAGRFATREDLEAQIIDFTLAHNEAAEPYQWRYNAEAEHARYVRNVALHYRAVGSTLLLTLLPASRPSADALPRRNQMLMTSARAAGLR